MLKFIIREGTRTRYAGGFGPYPIKSSIWFSPARGSDFSIEITDGITSTKREFSNKFEIVFKDTYEISILTDSEPNEKGMYNFTADAKRIKKLVANEKPKESNELPREIDLTEPLERDSDITKDAPVKSESDQIGPKPSRSKSKN